MISLAALVVTIYLRYPKFSFVNDQTKSRVKFAIVAVVLAIALPSVYFYYNLLQENIQSKRIENYVTNEIESRPGIFITNKVIKTDDSGTLIRLNINGTYLQEEEIASLDSQLVKYNLKNSRLKIIQSQPIGFQEQRLASLKTDIITELYHNSAKSIESKEQEIAFLQEEVQKLSRANFLSEKVMKLAKTQYNIDEIGVDIMVYSNGDMLDTIPTAIVTWSSKLSNSEKRSQSNKLAELIKIELAVDNVKVVGVN
jgi:hypothetical protein